MYAILTYERSNDSTGVERMSCVNRDKNEFRNMEYIPVPVYNYHLEHVERPDVFVHGPDAE